MPQNSRRGCLPGAKLIGRGGRIANNQQDAVTIIVMHNPIMTGCTHAERYQPRRKIITSFWA